MNVKKYLQDFFMQETTVICFGICVFAVFVVLFCCLICYYGGLIRNNIEESKKEVYKQGYIDCAKDFYKGKMKVDLIENPDGTKEWKWINEK